MSNFGTTLRHLLHPRSLPARSLFYFGSVGVLLAVILTWGAALYQKSVVFEQLERRGRLITRNLAQACVLPLMLEDENALRTLLADIRNQEDVQYVTLRDKDKNVMLDFSSEDAPHLELSPAPSAGPAVQRTEDALHFVTQVSMERARKWDMTQVFSEEDATGVGGGEKERVLLGTVHLGMSTARSDARVRRFLCQSAAGTTLVLAFGGLVSFLLFRRGVIRPLERLVEATREVSRGHLDLQLGKLGDTLEFDLLASAFNKMTFDLREAKNELLGINQVLEDRVHERTLALEEANAELQKANAHLKELIELKSKFVSMVSHELRTPLATIKGFVSTMLEYKDKVTPERRAQFMQIIKAESERLARLIEELLDISRVQEGRVEVRAAPVDLVDIIGRVQERYRLRTSKVSFTLEKPAAGCGVYADADKVEQILINLYDNALRFSPEKAAIRTRVREENGQAVVEVQDEGPGLGADEVEKVFEAFYRSDNETNTRAPGTGLGLTISRALAEAMGGGLTASNAEPRGARFSLSLPREARKREPAGNGKTQISGGGNGA